MNRHSATRDLTATTRHALPTMAPQLLFLCSKANEPHKGYRPGALFRGKVPMRCAACVANGAR